MAGDPRFGARYTGMCAIAKILEFADDVGPFAPLACAYHPAPRVRHMALKCVRESVQRGVPAPDVIARLGDAVRRVAREAAKVVAAAASVPGFPQTEFVLGALVEQAVGLGCADAPRPFSAVG